MKSVKKEPPTILIDTREKQPCHFIDVFKAGKIKGTIRTKLDAGDYTIEGAKDLVVVERKKSLNELYNNFIPDEMKERFWREMERMQYVKHKYLVVCQEWSALYDSRNFPFIKQNKEIAGRIIMSNVISLMNDFGIQVIFAGMHAEHTIASILLKTYHEAK